MQDLESLSKEDLLAKVEELSKEVKSLKRQKKFGLVWENKPEKVATDCEKMLPVVEEVTDKTIGKAGDKPANIIIEGDNYHALSVLNCTHADKIDIIYIDPPYNTGNKDFRYNDDYVDKEDSYKHSKWLSFMSKRLALAKNLLNDAGVIFISIDDNEMANLKLVCDSIFGPECFVGCLPRITKKSGKQHSNNIANNHDYVLVYTSSNLSNTFCGIQVKADSYPFKDEYYSERGGYQLNQTLDYSSLFYNEAMDYEININGDKFYAGSDKTKWKNRHNGDHKNIDWVWRWGKQKLAFGLENGFVVVKNSKNGKRIYTKTYAKASIGKRNNKYYIDYIKRENNLSSLSLTDNNFSNDNAKKEFQKIMPNVGFDFPKPSILVRQLLEIVRNKDSIVLDFFAGSGTTGQAVLELNKEDGGNRQFILCTNNEGDIAEEVTYPRIKTVVTGKRQDNSKYSDGIPANVRYFKTAFVDKGQSNDDTRENLIERATDIFRIKENAFEEELCADNFRVYSGGEKIMTVVFDPFELKNIWPKIESIYDKIGAENVRLYIFSYSSDVTAFTDEIPQDTKVQWEAMPIPEGILATYKKLFKEVK